MKALTASFISIITSKDSLIFIKIHLLSYPLSKIKKEKHITSLKGSRTRYITLSYILSNRPAIKNFLHVFQEKLLTKN